MEFYGCIPRFIKNHAGWILTALGLGGMTATVVLASKETLEADKAITVERATLYNKAFQLGPGVAQKLYNPETGMYRLPELTFGEKFEIAAPIYLPAFLTGLFTAGCMVGAQIFNAKRQAALIAAYGLLAQQFGQYRKTIVAECGEDVDRRAFKCSQMEVQRLQKELAKMKEENGPFLYTFAWLPGVVFESNPKHMNNVMYHFTRNMFMGRGSLAELCELTGLSYITREGWDLHEYGWDPYENEITWGSMVGAFEIEQFGRLNDMPLYLIDFSIPPYRLGLDYGMTDSSTEYEYENYNPQLAMQYALHMNGDEVEKFEQPDLYVQDLI